MPATRYTVILKSSANGTTELEPDTQKRRAIRRLRQALRWRESLPVRTRGEVRAYPDGAKRGTLIYQAHIDKDGTIHVEEL